MRVLAVAACVTALAIGSALGQGYVGPGACHKGIFWPFVREKGDCLTDTEKKNGMTGTYEDPGSPNGAPLPVQEPPLNKNAYLNAPQPKPAPAAAAAPAPAPAPAASGGGSFFGLFGSNNARSALGPGLLDDNPALAKGAPEPVAAPATAAVVAAAPAPPAPAKAPAPAPAPAPTAVALAGNPPPVATAPAPVAAPANTGAAVAATGAAVAGCNKGIFWPFVRDKGDCLTDVEKKNGEIGNYLDPHPQAAPPPAPATVASLPNNAAPSPAALPAPAPAAVPSPAALPAPAPAAAPSAATGCTKGIFWPFSRSKGDCLTDVEKKNGETGNYLDPHPEAAALPAPPAAPATVAVIDSNTAAAPAAPPPRPAVPAPVPAIANAPPPAPAPATVEKCTKGIFWPFVREKGSCLTDAEKKNGQTGYYLEPNPGAAPAMPAVATAPPAPAPAAASAPAANQSVALIDNNAARAPVAPAAAPPPAPVPAAPAEPDGAVKCTKGIFWPFLREKGACLTDAEKKNGLTGNYQDPTAGSAPVPAAAAPAAAAAPIPAASSPAQAPRNENVAAVSAPAPAPVAPAAASVPTPAAAPDEAKCTKGIFWPFVREKGDCLTDAEKRNAANAGRTD